MPKQVPFRSFVMMFKSELRDQHMSIAKVTNNMGRSHAYVYRILGNYDKRKYISLKLLKRIGQGFGLDKTQFNNWITSMSLIHPMANRYQSEKPSPKHKNTKLRKDHLRRNRSHESHFRYQIIGQIINILHELDIDDLKTIRLITTRFNNSKHH